MQQSNKIKSTPRNNQQDIFKGFRKMQFKNVGTDISALLKKFYPLLFKRLDNF